MFALPESQVKWSAEYLKECFEYDGQALIWKDRPRHHFKSDKAHKCFKAKMAGKRAGRTMTGQGYVQILIDGRRMLAHRLILMMHGHEVNGVVDHIDRNPANNTLANLRVCTQQQNIWNSCGWANKKSRLPRGIGPTNSGKFYANIRLNGRNVRLGTFATCAEAVAARASAERSHFGEFASAASAPA